MAGISNKGIRVASPVNLRVLSIAYPFAPVSRDSVGGAEQVLAMLDEALVERGHTSLVIAPESSSVRGTLLPLALQAGTIDDQLKQQVYQSLRDRIARTLATSPVDLVHLHGIDFPEYLPPGNVPVLATLHLPLSWYPPEIFHLKRPRTYLHCVSQGQHNTAPPGAAHLLPPIPNGVDLQTFHPRGRAANFAMTLSRICPEKGTAIALRVCRSTGMPLLIGGFVYPYEAHQIYFEQEVKPLLDACRRFLGPLPLARKAALLSKATCLLIPSLAPETSSLVAMEAIASGCPVIAFEAGALPGIVEDGVTGFLVRDESEMRKRLGQVSEIDRTRCRQSAIERFSHLRSVEMYFEAYRRILNL